MNIKISKFDKKAYKMIRKNIIEFIKEKANLYDKKGKLILDIAPEIHNNVSNYFEKAKLETLDLVPKYNPTYVADITKNNKDIIPNNKFDFIFCLEVLEHILNPFHAVKEIKRIIKPNGKIFVSSPFNFRIHRPLPDCWRFTEHGLKELFKDFNRIKIDKVSTRKRNLMPIHYTLEAIK